MFFHPLCTSYETKKEIFVQQGLWFVDDASECQLARVAHEQMLLLLLLSALPAAARPAAAGAGCRLRSPPTLNKYPALPLLCVCAACQPRNGTTTNVTACQPLQWKEPTAEHFLYDCPQFDLALTHARLAAPPPPAPPLSNSTAQNATA
jgi:hypothetical protein